LFLTKCIPVHIKKCKKANNNWGVAICCETAFKGRKNLKLLNAAETKWNKHSLFSQSVS
jgi:hypothetical protein